MVLRLSPSSCGQRRAARRTRDVDPGEELAHVVAAQLLVPEPRCVAWAIREVRPVPEAAARRRLIASTLAASSSTSPVTM